MLGVRAYNALEDLQYQNYTVVHKQNWVDPHTLTCKNYIEGTWNCVKSNIQPRNRTSKIQNHLTKFIWRRHNNRNLWDAFLRSLSTSN